MTSDVESLQHDLRWADDALTKARREHEATMEALLARRASVAEQLQRARVREQVYAEECPLSTRVGVAVHGWRWDGDDPRVVCAFCGEVRDALTGRILIAGRRTEDGAA